MTEALGQLIVDYKKVCETLQKLTQYSSSLHSLYKGFNTKTEIGKAPGVQSTYGSLMTTFTMMEKATWQQIKSIRQAVFKNVKKNEEELGCLMEIHKMRNKAKEEYFKVHLALEDKKEKLLNDKNFSDWGINTNKVGLELKDILKNRNYTKHLMLDSVRHYLV